MDASGRWNSDGTWPDPAHLLTIDNTNVAPKDAAMMIRHRFGLTAVP
jgi:hypothetical protein